MNRVLLFESMKDQKGLFTLTHEEDKNHILNHLKANVGQKIKVALENKGLALAEVIQTSPQLILKPYSLEDAQERHYHLLIAASRPPTMKKVFEHGTALGVKSFHVFTPELGEKSYLTSRIYEEDQLFKLLKEGTEQSAVFCDLPKVFRHKNLKEALKAMPSESERFVLSLEDGPTFGECSIKNKEITLAVGPERGWTENEEEALLKEGYKRIKLSPSVLRVEIATFVALGQLEMIALKG